MDILQKNTRIETEQCNILLSLDKQDRVALVLGINKVVIEYVNGSWLIRCGTNIKVEQTSSQDESNFVPRGVGLDDVFLELESRKYR